MTVRALIGSPADEPKPPRHWTTANKILAGTTGALQLADWLQTLAFRRRGDREGNPLLGPYPSDAKINTLIPLAIAASHGLGALMPSKARNAWYGGLSALELASVLNNALRGRRATVRASIPVGSL